jgi:hypothetical protein
MLKNKRSNTTMKLNMKTIAILAPLAVLGTSAVADAQTTYDFSTPGSPGAVTGTVTYAANGTLAAWDLIVSAGGESVTFDSALAGNTSQLSSPGAFTSTGAVASFIQFNDASDNIFNEWIAGTPPGALQGLAKGTEDYDSGGHATGSAFQGPAVELGGIAGTHYDLPQVNATAAGTVTAAPEISTGTAASAMTLLLGSLAVLRSPRGNARRR